MSVYFNAHLEILDREHFEEYAAGVIRTLKPYRGWVLTAGPGKHMGGAEPRNHNVIIRFPTEELALAWWDSAEYQEIVPIRLASARGADAVLVPGLDGSVDVSSLERYAKQPVEVDGKRMVYVEAGTGDPIVLLHGNPTSSYLWRNVIPYLESLGRCIAPDLIGMGDSDKLDESGAGTYRYVEHRRYLDGLLEQLGVSSNVTLVVHDWGGALGFDWAERHRDALRGIAYMETIVAPIPDWDDWPNSVRPVFQGFRSDQGEAMVIEKNMFVEKVLPGAVMRRLGDAEMNAYRRPYLAGGESRRPTLTWPRELPIAGEPSDVHDVAVRYSEWLATSNVPKLFINADPGAILRGRQREICRTWKNQTEVTVPGVHFIQEDSPDEIGRAIAGWLSTL